MARARCALLRGRRRRQLRCAAHTGLRVQLWTLYLWRRYLQLVYSNLHVVSVLLPSIILHTALLAPNIRVLT